MEEYNGKICPFCKTEIEEGDAVKICPSCGVTHHEDCWKKNRGCAMLDCSERYDEAKETTHTDVCQTCGTPLSDDQMFCPKCGTQKSTVNRNVCGKCGTELQEGQEFCPKCGQKAGRSADAGVNSAVSQLDVGVDKRNTKKKKLFLIIGAVAAVIVALSIVLIIMFSRGKRKDFNDLYGNLSIHPWCTIASDGSYLKIDTNPQDKDEDDMTTEDYNDFLFPAYDAIKRMNKELGFSDALMEKMDSTTWSQGKQSDSNSEYTVTWSYHPDMGLEVMYELKE